MTFIALLGFFVTAMRRAERRSDATLTRQSVD
jgi:hypothetical protein